MRAGKQAKHEGKGHAGWQGEGVWEFGCRAFTDAGGSLLAVDFTAPCETHRPALATGLERRVSRGGECSVGGSSGEVGGCAWVGRSQKVSACPPVAFGDSLWDENKIGEDVKHADILAHLDTCRHSRGGTPWATAARKGGGCRTCSIPTNGSR